MLKRLKVKDNGRNVTNGQVDRESQRVYSATFLSSSIVMIAMTTVIFSSVRTNLHAFQNQREDLETRLKAKQVALGDEALCALDDFIEDFGDQRVGECWGVQASMYVRRFLYAGMWARSIFGSDPDM